MKARVLFLVAAFLWPTLASSPALAQTRIVELASSERTVVHGDTVILSGAIVGDPSCVSGRSVTLQWRPADSAGFATVAQGTSAADGTFVFEQAQPHTGRYRAQLPQEGSCPAALSDDLLVRVRARVDASLVVGSTEAGQCVDVSVAVMPAKPGQTVDLQHRRGGWATRDALTLDASGTKVARPCLGWDDIGVLRLRVRWEAQDALNETAVSTALAVEVTEAAWMRAIDEIVGGRAVSVSVGEGGTYLYRHADQARRIPASNEKLLLAMAMLDTFGPGARIRTRAAAVAVGDGVVDGDLWILGRGDPQVGGATMRALARRIADAGITRVAGRVMGSTTYFRRDWDAAGWNSEARRYVNRPTALTYEGNRSSLPERAAAEALTRRLGRLGVRVTGEPGAGAPPDGLADVAEVRSPTVLRLLTRMLRPSDNFAAEVLGKRLAAEVHGPPGTIAKAAATIRDWAATLGAGFTLHDSSGLSYDNRVTAEGIVRLLWEAEGSDWGADLRRALPTGGQGTLRARLPKLRLRAKTGTLTGASALSGWVFAPGPGAWIEFSILSSGMSKPAAAAIEDRIVRIVRTGVG